MNSLKASVTLYRDCIVGATKSLIANWLILVGSVAAYLVYSIAITLFGPLGLAGGFIIGLIQVALLSLYYAWLQTASNRERIKPPDLIRFDYGIFFTTISVAFVVSIGLLLVRSFQVSPDTAWVVTLIQFGAVVVFNAAPEVIYISRSESIAALTEAFQFVKTFWIEWFIPLLIMAAPLMAFDGKLLLVLLSDIEALLLPATVVLKIWAGLGPFATGLNLALGIVLANWFMLFRAILFKELQSGGYRRRAYRAR